MNEGAKLFMLKKVFLLPMVTSANCFFYHFHRDEVALFRICLYSLSKIYFLLLYLYHNKRGKLQEVTTLKAVRGFTIGEESAVRF